MAILCRFLAGFCHFLGDFMRKKGCGIFHTLQQSQYIGRRTERIYMNNPIEAGILAIALLRSVAAWTRLA